ncbi:MAG: beta-galactosidase [Chloroflexota bacterium]|nr:beta-galactosidase [Chloroflexota bacterium]
MVTKTVYKQIRGFVAIWLSITFVMGLSTFLAIYFTYNPSAVDPGSSNPLPLVTQAQETPEEAPAPVVVLPSVTPEPTSSPTSVAQEPAVPVMVYEATDIPTLTSTPASIPTPTLPPVADARYQVGIQVEHAPDLNADNQDAWYNSVAGDLGLTWVKQEVRWELMEPEQGQIDWSALDLLMRSAEKYAVKLLLSVVTAPDWAREPGVVLERHGPPADPQVYADFLAAILERYPGRIHAIEIWKAQNIDREWTSVNGLNAADYVKLLQTSYETIKAIEPGLIVISGALSPTGVNDGVRAYDDFNYMDQLINAGVLDWADCVGARHNGYNIGPDYRYNEIPDDPTASFRGPFDNPHHSWSFRSTLEGYANRIRAAGKDTQLCVTKFGWPSAEDLEGLREGFDFAYDNTLEEQAEWIPQAMSNMADWDFVWLAFIWNLNYGPQADWAVDNDNVPYSLIGPGFNFRPAYDAIRAWQRDYQTRTRA